MKKPAEQRKPFMNIKKKMSSAVAMLLFAALLMTTASYAWFELVNAPETKHIAANVGANGSLEIALLNTDTRSNLSMIRADIGDSMEDDNLLANTSWGNLVDLGIANYGLHEISLMPARLNVMPNGANESYVVDSGILSVPTYGYDGRIIELSYNAVSAIYRDNAFSLVTGRQDFGVRGIGTSDVLSSQASALALAKSNISSNYVKTRSGAVASLENGGNSLFNILLYHMLDSEMTYIDEDRDALRLVLGSLESVLQDLDATLRQGLVAFAAAAIDDETAFQEVKNSILDTSVEIRQILEELPKTVKVPDEFVLWSGELDDMQNDLNQAIIDCDALTGNNYTWTQMRSILDRIMNADKLHINGRWFNELDFDSLFELLEEDIVLTLAKDSGIYADIAKFVDDYSTIISMDIASAMVVVDNEEPRAYLPALTDLAMDLKAAESSAEGAVVPLTATYGYALDLAFRCNTEGADLQLQTAPRQRVYDQEGEVAAPVSMQGDGSYMAFQTFDKQLADAIRVGFVDDQGVLLAIAKLNTSERTAVEEMIRMPLYLYGYSFEADDAGLYLTMDELPKEDHTILSSENMQRNIPKAVTVVVWLDGDIVDNTMVAAAEETSLSGVMNLQFATSANLTPLVEDSLMEYTVDKASMEALLDECKPIVEEGRENRTTVSWQRFTEAYEHAQLVFQENTFRESQVRTAVLQLTAAKDGLEIISREPLTNKTAQVRELTGALDDETIYLSVQNKDDSISVITPSEYKAEEMKIVGRVNAVNSGKNQNYEGNGIYTPIYTQDSWDVLVSALYEAEALLLQETVAEEQLDYALSVLEAAEKSLERELFFRPYAYQNTIYYEAICESENADTYGKWYDSGFRRIVSDLTIVNLDAYAQTADAAQIQQDTYVASDTPYINPEIVLEDNLYQQLKDETMSRVQWNDPDPNMFTERMAMRHLNAINDLLRIVKERELKIDTSSAEKLVSDFSGTPKPTVDSAVYEIRKLNDAVVAALQEQGEYGPVISTDILYDVKYPDILLELTGKSGKTILDARILTESGILISASKEIVVYDRADGLEISEAEAEEPMTALELVVGETVKLTADLLYEAGGQNTGDKPVDSLLQENIKTFLWASEDTEVASIAGKDMEVCSVTAHASGQTAISVMVKTVEGNTYTLSIPVSVYETQ